MEDGYYHYECRFCDWDIFVPIPLLEFEINRQLTCALIDNHIEVHVGEVMVAADQMTRG